MPSSSSNLTGVHFTLIFFVMISLILGAVSYLKIKEAGEQRVKAAAAEDENRKLEATRRTMDDEIQALKKKIGYENDPVGLDSADPATVLAKLEAELNRSLGPAGSRPESVDKVLAELRSNFDKIESEYNQASQLLAQEKTERTNLEQQYEARLKAASDAQAAAETTLGEEQTRMTEIVDGKQRQVDQLTGEKRNLEIRIAQEREAHDAAMKELDRKNNDLVVQNTHLREQLDEMQKVSFEVPDGEIRYVDHSRGLVYINLGSADNVQPRATFSVYTKDHQGVGRGAEDIIGSIEVTRVIDAHLAEAQIAQKDVFAPISKGDLVYSPIWTPGRREVFAVAGLIDFDGDGQSDRDLLHAVIQASGGRVEYELKDDGTRTGGKLSGDTKFLVKGDIPEERTGLEKEQAIAKNLQETYAEMKEEARGMGVREVKLHDFLAWVGYKPTRRLWRPGMDVPWMLKAGAQSPSADEMIGNRASSGQTSGLYMPRGRTSQPRSTGQTSKLFRGGASGY